MAATDVEGAAQRVPAMVQSVQLRRLRVVVSGLCVRAAGAFGKAGDGCGAEQAAILKG